MSDPQSKVHENAEYQALAQTRLNLRASIEQRVKAHGAQASVDVRRVTEHEKLRLREVEARMRVVSPAAFAKLLAKEKSPSPAPEPEATEESENTSAAETAAPTPEPAPAPEAAPSPAPLNSQPSTLQP